MKTIAKRVVIGKTSTEMVKEIHKIISENIDHENNYKHSIIIEILED